MIAGFVLAGLSLVIGLLAIPALVIGILVITRGRTGRGAAIVTLAVVLPVIGAIVVFGILDARAFRVPSEGMLPTLEPGDRSITSDVSDPERGDILVFHPPLGAEDNSCGVPSSPLSPCPQPTPERSSVVFIMRVVAVPGDRIAIVDGRVRLNGERQDEPFIRPDATCGICNLRQAITVPENHYFMLGDNRGQSADSREWGPITEASILGKVRLRYWPLSRIGSP